MTTGRQWLKRQRLWLKWQRQMGTVSEYDLTMAKAWFDELYDAGHNGKACPLHCGAPLAYDERQVFELGYKAYRKVHLWP